MISGAIEALENYLPVLIKDKVMSYIKSVGVASPEGYTYLVGDQVYGRVMSYSSKLRKDCDIEAHNKYVDIQLTISGVEGIDVFHRDKLETVTPYCEENDVEFLREKEQAMFAEIRNYPGYFSMFFPEDAHRPMIAVDGKLGHIKKFVVKIDRTLFESV